MARVHIIGAGVSGLACAIELIDRGVEVAVYEAAPQAGGRCRSFHDEVLGCRIDNGNHLLLAGNHAAMSYLQHIGAGDSLRGPEEPAIPFIDLESGARWTVRPNNGLLPWWILTPWRRVPGSRAGDYLAALALGRAAPGASVADCLDPSRPLYRRFWEPFTVAVLNARPEEAAAALLWPVIVEVFGRGGRDARPRIAAKGLSDSLIAPAIERIRERRGVVRLSTRVRALERADGRVAALTLAGERIGLAQDEAAVLAVPPQAAAELMPGLTVPQESRPIVNAHYRLPSPAPAPDQAPLLGVIGGLAQWLFFRGDVVSVTVSAATSVVDQSVDWLAQKLWQDVARALALDGATVPPCRIVKERRATFAQIPAEVERRPGTRSELANLFLAGDWTDTGLPATIEGAVRSGHRAAEAVAHVLPQPSL